MNRKRTPTPDGPPRWPHAYLPCQNPDHQPPDHCNFCFMPEDWPDHAAVASSGGAVGTSEGGEG